MARILFIYSSVDGHTLLICQRLQRIAEKENNSVEVTSVSSANSVDLASFDKVIIGASIHYGKHSREVYAFIKQHRLILDTKPNAFFTVNVVARKPDKCDPDTNPYLIKFLNQINWKPKMLGVFAGKLEYNRYSFIDRFMIRLIMLMTKGPTAADTNIEFTNWARVEEFGHAICDMK